MLLNQRYEQITTELHQQGNNADVVTKRKITKHLSDINDTITDEDIKNVKTNFGNLPVNINQLPVNQKQNNN